MKILLRTVCTILLLLASVGTYFAVVSLYHADLVSRHYIPQCGLVHNSSSASGAWEQQNLGLGPAVGSENVPRNTALVIDEPRPARVENITFSPSVAIAEVVTEHFQPASAKVTVYTATLLKPNTTYNVSAVVAGEVSWWIFTTGNEPQQSPYETLPPMETVQVYAVVASALGTLAAGTCMTLFLRRTKRKQA